MLHQRIAPGNLQTLRARKGCAMMALSSP